MTITEIIFLSGIVVIGMILLMEIVIILLEMIINEIDGRIREREICLDGIGLVETKNFLCVPSYYSSILHKIYNVITKIYPVYPVIS